TVRKHLSAIKGGQLAVASRAVCRTFVISDVVGDDLSVIASGPTVADPTTFADALAVIDWLAVAHGCPEPVLARLRRGVRGGEAETPKEGDDRLARAQAEVIGSRHDAMRGAAAEASRRGYRVLTIEEPIVGEAREAARKYAGRLREAAALE